MRGREIMIWKGRMEREITVRLLKSRQHFELSVIRGERSTEMKSIGHND